MRNFGKLFVFTTICLIGVVSIVSAEEITIVGTGAGTVILEAIGEAFSQKNPGITITVPPSIGSGGGIKAVGRDEYLLGRVARGIKEKEKPYGLTYVPYAKIPIVFYVNTSVTVKDLSPQQIVDIYRGKITNWKEVGGKNRKIILLGRDSNSGTYESIKKLVMGKKVGFSPRAKTLQGNAAVLRAVSRSKGSIGYVGAGYVKRAKNIVVLSVSKSTGGKAYKPTAKNVK